MLDTSKYITSKIVYKFTLYRLRKLDKDPKFHLGYKMTEYQARTNNRTHIRLPGDQASNNRESRDNVREFVLVCLVRVRYISEYPSMFRQAKILKMYRVVHRNCHTVLLLYILKM